MISLSYLEVYVIVELNTDRKIILIKNQYTFIEVIFISNLCTYCFIKDVC